MATFHSLLSQVSISKLDIIRLAGGRQVYRLSSSDSVNLQSFSHLKIPKTILTYYKPCNFNLLLVNGKKRIMKLRFSFFLSNHFPFLRLLYIFYSEREAKTFKFFGFCQRAPFDNFQFI